MNINRLCVLSGITLLILVSFYSEIILGDTFSSIVDDKGNISRPTDFKEKWIYLGSWVHPDSSKDVASRFGGSKTVSAFAGVWFSTDVNGVSAWGRVSDAQGQT